MAKATKKRAPGADVDNSITRAPPLRWQRGSACEEVVVEEGGRKVQRTLTGLWELEREGTISPAEVVAALRWQRDYESGVLGARDPEQSGSSGSGGVTAWMAAVVDAVSAYRRAAEAVGPRGEALLRAYVSDGLSIRAMSQAGMGNRRTLAKHLSEALFRLSAHYAELQRAHEAGRASLRISAGDRDEHQEKHARRMVDALGMRGMSPDQAVAVVRQRLAVMPGRKSAALSSGRPA